ncbi:MAG: AAA family ATPase, partial [Candidatus Dormibacteraeota bacterium]|nr:AAA family ATPase [Candidatus Dormibacteraeota bacterium]
MRVHRIALRHYRGVEAVEVELDPTGVTVIEGPNGVGKTSLVEALAVGLGTAETSRSRAVMALQPVGEDVAPEIELDVESGAYRFTLSKGYLKRPRATLRVVAPRDETLAGGQVHDRVNEILDLSGVDRNLLRSLWVHQGGEMAQVGLKECPSLGRALDEAAGQTPSGELEESVLDRVRKEASRFLTPGGAELKWLSDLRTAVSRAEKELVEARSIEQSLQEQMERSERAASGLAALGEQLDALRSAA